MDICYFIVYNLIQLFVSIQHFDNKVDHMLSRMLQVHRDKPKCWHIAACWKLEENKNKHNARQYLLRDIQICSDSQLLYIDVFKSVQNISIIFYALCHHVITQSMSIFFYRTGQSLLATASNAKNTENQKDSNIDR